MVGAVRHQGLPTAAAGAIEELLKGARHFHLLVVLVDFVQLAEDLLKPVLRIWSTFSKVLHLLPDNSSKAREQADDSFLLFLAELHLHLVETDAFSPFLVVGGLPIEQRNVVVSHHVTSASSSGSRAIGGRRFHAEGRSARLLELT